MMHTSIPAVEIINASVPMVDNFDVNFNDTGIATGVKKRTLLASADRPMLLEVFAEVETAFNAGTTNVLTLGTSSTANELLGSSDITEATPGFYPASNAIVKKRVVANTEIWAKYTQTGTAGTTGLVKFYVRVTPLF